MPRHFGNIDALTGSGMSGANLMTSTNTITSVPVRTENADLGSVQVSWTGTPVGNFKLQVSDDLPGAASTVNSPGGTVITNWTDLASSTWAAGGAAGTQLLNLATCPYAWLRVSYTNTSGTGTVSQVQVVTKGAG